MQVSSELREKLVNYIRDAFNRAKTIGYKVNPELFIKANISQWVKLHFSKLDFEERMALREQLYKEEFIEKK